MSAEKLYATEASPVSKALGEIASRQASQVWLLEIDCFAAVQQPNLWYLVTNLYYLTSRILLIAYTDRKYQNKLHPLLRLHAPQQF